MIDWWGVEGGGFFLSALWEMIFWDKDGRKVWAMKVSLIVKEMFSRWCSRSSCMGLLLSM
jgi:hypothetical protein